MAVLKDLIVHGPSRFINIAQFESLKTNKIGAEEGIFNKIVATTGDIGSLTVEDLTAGKATVLSLLDVRGELHTNQWTNSNIATIDGSFYITPTIGVNSGTMTTTANSVIVNGSNFPISSLYVNGINSDNTAGTVAWTSGSKVLVTGEILVNGTYMPLGTLVGVLDGDATATQIKIKSITDNRYQTAESLAEIGTQSTALPCRNVKISLYQTSRSSTLYPLGIFMTALGENGKTFLDIYGGGYAASTAVAGGFAKPVLRIGNLAGLPAIGTQTPTGYGIYTSNGYFSGTVAAKKGVIGDGATAWTIGSGTGTGSVSYIYAPTNGPTSKTANTVGMYVGTDGINNFNTTTQYVRIYDGKIYAQGADISGAITATSFEARGYSGTTLQRKVTVDSAGLNIYDGSNNLLSQFGATTSTIGRTSGNNYNIYIDSSAINLRYNTNILNQIDSSGMTIYDGTASDDANIVANFGKTISLGQVGGSRINLNTNQFIFYDKNNSPYFELSQGATITTTILKTTTLQITIDQTDLSGSTEYTLNSNELTAYNNNTLQVSLSGYSHRLGEASYAFETTNGATKIRVCFYANEYVSGVSVTLKTYQTTDASKASLTFGSRKGTIGSYSIAMGLSCTASGVRSFAIGGDTEASNVNAIAVGNNTTASNSGAFAEGYNTIASGSYSHAAGDGSQATKYASYAIGNSTLADGYASFAAGEYTKAQSQGQFVIGRYNNNKTTNAFEIGWGDSENTRENIFEVNTSGNVIDGSGTQLINKAMVACGTTGRVSIGANSTAYIDVSFGKTFSSAPIVVCSLYSTSTAYSDIGKIRCWVTSVTTTGCRIYFYNQATAQRAPAAYWQAMSI